MVSLVDGSAPWMQCEEFEFEGLVPSDTASPRTELPDLPDEVLAALLVQLDFAQVGRLATTSRRLRNVVAHGESSYVWLALASRCFPQDTALAEQLHEAVQREDGSEAQKLTETMCRRARCLRCRETFRLGDARACAVHPGVLISGHRTNGLAAAWTCCNAPRHAVGSLTATFVIRLLSESAAAPPVVHRRDDGAPPSERCLTSRG
jgi:hypothetical protein